MSDKKNGTMSYISIGTIRVRIGKDGGIGKMFFSPTKDFSVSHAGKEYLALLPAKGNSGCGILAPFDSKNGLRIGVNGSFSGTDRAAIKQCAVQIEVKAKGGKWLLRAVTIPAGSQTK